MTNEKQLILIMVIMFIATSAVCITFLSALDSKAISLCVENSNFTKETCHFELTR